MENAKIVWFEQADDGMDFKETTFVGAIIEAVQFILQNLAEKAGFVLGQVLTLEGKVAATIAPNGAVKYA